MLMSPSWLQGNADLRKFSCALTFKPLPLTQALFSLFYFFQLKCVLALVRFSVNNNTIPNLWLGASCLDISEVLFPPPRPNERSVLATWRYLHQRCLAQPGCGPPKQTSKDAHLFPTMPHVDRRGKKTKRPHRCEVVRQMGGGWSRDEGTLMWRLADAGREREDETAERWRGSRQCAGPAVTLLFDA